MNNLADLLVFTTKQGIMGKNCRRAILWLSAKLALCPNQLSRRTVMENRQEIVVTDIKMPFMSMVVFMLKWAIASIPAFIIFSILFVLFTLIFGGFMGGMHSMGPGF
jgi:hypothetical protein